MVWNDIIAWINGNVAEIGVIALSGLEFMKMVGNRLNFNKVYNSTVTPITSSNNVVFNKVNEAISLVTKLSNEVAVLKDVSLSKDKQIETLSSLLVSTLSVANVPVSAKQDFFNAIAKAKVVSDDTSLVLAKMIEAQQRQASTVQVSNDEAINALKNGV